MQNKVKISKFQRVKNFIKKHPKKIIAGVATTAAVGGYLVKRNYDYNKKIKQAYICNQPTVDKLFRFLNDLNIKLNKNCFVRGAYVFEDPGNIIFYSLINDNCNDITRDRGTKCFISHDSFWTNKKHPNNIINENEPLTFFNKKRAMYEKLVDNHVIMCNGTFKNIKVILFYPFTTLDNKRYLYLKIETSPCFTATHVKDFAHSKTNTKTHLVDRRESKKYSEKMKVDDDIFYKKFNLDNNIIEEYNQQIRVGSELFIPYQIYQKVYKK